MISIEEMETMLDEIANELPEEFYKDLNGGVVLLPEMKMHEKSMSDDLYVMGEYHSSRNLGRYISIYYGSFSALYGRLSKPQIKEKLKNTLKHEFKHHLESLSGEHELETQDSQKIAEYIYKKKNRGMIK